MAGDWDEEGKLTGKQDRYGQVRTERKPVQQRSSSALPRLHCSPTDFIKDSCWESVLSDQGCALKCSAFIGYSVKTTGLQREMLRERPRCTNSLTTTFTNVDLPAMPKSTEVN